MLHLILVRHGETEWNLQRRYQGHTNVPLSAFGRRQAECIAARLAHQKLDAIYASDLERARETAGQIAIPHGLSVISEPRLRELKFGILEGLTFDEAQARYPDMIATWLEDFNQPPQGAETVDLLNARIVCLLEDLKKVHEGQTVLLVGHGGSLGELLRVVLGLSPEKRWYFEMENTSLTEILMSEGFVSFKRLNDTAHVAVLTRSPTG